MMYICGNNVLAYMKTNDNTTLDIGTYMSYITFTCSLYLGS